MTLFCEAPDTSAGVAIGLAGYLDCQARALGENGFQALAGGPIGMSLLSGLLTIFVGLIGYRMILGEIPGIRHGVNWMVRVGFVLALVTSWPAFQTLIYRVAFDGPVELAAIVVPASGLAGDAMDQRVQQAYDAIRIGTITRIEALPSNPQSSQEEAQEQETPTVTRPQNFRPAMPQTASLFVLSTSGITGAFRIAVGFLLAVGPLAIMALLFDATLGLFVGWIRALVGVAVASLATVVVTAIGLMLVESELASERALQFGGLGQRVDPQGLMTIVLVISLITLVISYAAMRMTGAFILRRPVFERTIDVGRTSPEFRPREPFVRSVQEPAERVAQGPARTRAAGVAEALAATVRREQAILVGASGRPAGGGSPTSPAYYGVGPGAVAPRLVGRRTRSAARRDKSGS